MEKVIRADELASGERRSVIVDDIPALAVRVDDTIYLIEDVCSHDGQPLADGPLQDTSITCARHGARFDLETGAAQCMPATKGIRVFDVEIRDGDVWAGLSKTPKPATVPSSDGTPSDSTAAQSDDAADSESDSTAEEEAPQESVGPGGQRVTGTSPSTESDYLEALRQVIDPELFINIVDLGLIYAIEQDEENPRRIKIDMTLTSPACPAGPQLVQQSKMALERLHDVDEAAINMVMSPPWSPERMTDEARDQLGIF